MFGASSSAPAFGTPSTPAIAPAFGSSLLASPAISSPFSQQVQQSPFPQTPAFGFGTPSPFGAPQATLSVPNQQLTTQMAPVAPLPFSLADRDIQAIVDAYKEEPGNPKYAFKHLLFSVTDLAARVKPFGISDIMWAEAMGKLEGMESADRERLWPQLVQGFKDLSHRLMLQDDAIVSDADRLKMTQTNVKMLQRHFQTDTLSWIQKLRQKEQGLQQRILRIMRIVEALESKGFRVPLMKGEVELAEKLTTLARQLKGSGAELPRKVHNLRSISHVHANANGGGNSFCLPGSTKIHEQSLLDMHEVLQQQTEAIARLGNVLKRNLRDMEIIMLEDVEMDENGGI